MSALTFNQVIVGSAPTCATSFRGVKLMRMSRRFLTVRKWVRFRPLPPELTGGRKAMRAAVNRVRAGSSPAPSASFDARSSMAERAPYKGLIPFQLRAWAPCRGSSLVASASPTKRNSRVRFTAPAPFPPR